MRCWLTILVLLSLPGSVLGGSLHVDLSAPPGGDGTLWTTAFRDLQDALAAAIAGDEIRIAEGVYRADRGTLDPALAFEIPPGVTLLGGHPMGGGARDSVLHPTVLEGDLLGDDAFDPLTGGSGDADNTHRLVRIVGGVGTVLDGLVIRNGRSRLSANPVETWGGCLAIQGGDPVIRHCRIEAGFSEASGGGAVAVAAAVRFEDCEFVGNRAHSFGAGLALAECDGAVVIRCRFEGNVGSSGAGLFVSPLDFPFVASSSTQLLLEDCAFSANCAMVGATQGGAIYVGGGSGVIRTCTFEGNLANGGAGAYLVASDTVFDRCQFRGNTVKGDGGAGIFVDGGTLLSPPPPIATVRVVSGSFTGNGGGVQVEFSGQAEVINSTIAENEILGFLGNWPPVVVGQGSSLALRNTIVWDNHDIDFLGGLADILAGDGAITVDDCIIQDWDGSISGTGSGADPHFVGSDDFRLAANSPAVDAGNASWLPTGASLDVAGVSRFQDGDGDGIATVDLGAYERSASGFLRGDCSGDLLLDLADGVFVLAVVFLGNLAPCAEACDANADTGLDIADAVYVLSYLFNGGATPPAPFPTCGPGVGVLGCLSPACP